MRKGFTMVELIFVIVILGILAAVAIPRLNATRDDAEISKGASNLATLMTDLSTYYTSQGSFGATPPTGGAGGPNVTTIKWKDITLVKLASAADGTDMGDGALVSTPAFIKVKDKGCAEISVNIDTGEITAKKSGNASICTQFQGVSSVKDIIGTDDDGKKHTLGGSKVKF